jgi:hypothetical protein
MTTKRQIRWLQPFQQQIPSPAAESRPMSEVPEVTRQGNYVIFEKDREMTVSVHASPPPTISLPGVGRLVGAIEGEHFEFIDGESERRNSDLDSCADAELRDDLKFTDEQVRRFFMGMVVSELVSFFNGQQTDQNATKITYYRLEQWRRIVARNSVISSPKVYLTSFLQRAHIDVETLTLLLQEVGGFSPDEALLSAPVLARRCNFGLYFRLTK